MRYLSRNDAIWNDVVVLEDATIRDAIEKLNCSGIKLVLVVTLNDELLGTISDGDIRRALLVGANLDSAVIQVMKQDPVVARPENSNTQIEHLMEINSINQVPALDNSGILSGLYLWSATPEQFKQANTLVIMAGGQGKRLSPLTLDRPKPLIAVGKKPILEHLILRARSEGINNFVIAIHHLGHLIEEYFGDGEKFSVRIKYLREPEPLGTAGALSLLRNKLDIPFIVTNADLYSDIKFLEMLNFHNSQGAKATMAVRMHESTNPFGVVETDGFNIVSYFEKPTTTSIVNAGVYVLNPEAIEYLEDSKYCDMPTLLERMRGNRDKVVAYPLHEDWLDIGRIEDLNEAIYRQEISEKSE